MSERQRRATGLFRATPNRRDSAYYRIGVPAEIAVLVEGVQFRCELTDEGILYRPAVDEQPTAPAWLRRPYAGTGVPSSGG